MDHLPHLSDVNAVGRLLFGAALGVFIGLERQWRQKMSGGLQTCALVAAGATLFALITPLMNVSGDQTRIVAQIVTGIGFLAGGVILKEGMNVRGLNTAATIWATAAVGALSGLGIYLEAACGALVITGLNWFLSPFVDFIDRRQHAHREARFEITVVCDRAVVSDVSELVLDTVTETDLRIASRRMAAGPTAQTARLVSELTGLRRDEHLVNDLMKRIREHAGVLETSYTAQDTN